jgi:hypothetical protein
VRVQQRRALAIGGGVVVGLLGVYVVVASAASTWHDARRESRATGTPVLIATTDAKPPSAPKASAVRVAPEPSTPHGVDRPLTLVVPQGRTELHDSVIAERAGDSVIVDFDTQFARTRRRDKFERVVRETLPAVYGARADSMLAGIPVGSLVTGGDLLTELPSRGIHIPLSGKWVLEIWPETRSGQDGPLVVSYMTRVGKR